MSFFVRVFSLVEDYPSLRAICEELTEAGFEFATSPGNNEDDFEEKDWKNILFQYDNKYEPIELDRNCIDHKDNMFREEQREFLEVIKDIPYSKSQKKALEIIKNAKQIYAFDVDENITEAGWSFLECVLDYICDATDGYVQVDEEGIYNKDGEILVEIE